jgi:uncharacterized protein (TIGR03435 family)
MKPDERHIEEVLRRSLPSAPAEQMESALARIHARLQSDRGETVSDGFRHVDSRAVGGPVAPKRWRGWWSPVTAAAAALLVGAIWIGLSVRDGVVYAVLETPDRSLFRIADGHRVPVHAGERIGAQEPVQSNGGAVLALADGSHVEMRSQAELSLERAGDGVSIRLSTGSIIVNAAKQPSGHLYVQTKDMTVSVVGTIFLVNAEEKGSHVAVIEGEVRVQQKASMQQKATETKLHPGEQVATSPTLAARSVKQEIAWSLRADMYSAILASFAKGMADTAGSLRPLAQASGSVQAPTSQAGAAASGPQFEEASIRPCDPDNLPPAPAGARGGGANSFQMTPGRTHALCLTLATIVRHAYGYGPAQLDFLNPGGRGRGFNLNNVYGLGVEDGLRVRGGPDWVRSDHYTIEAVADGAADAATMSGPMMRDLLERRFQLKAHIETEQVPAFNLTVAKGGLKIKPVDADACTPPPPITPGVPMMLRPVSFADVRRGQKPTCGVSIQRNGPNFVVVGGAAQIGRLGLGGVLGQVQIFDKTGITDRFNYLLEFVIDENVRPLVLPPQDGDSSDVPRGQTVFAAVEDQLGLKLEPARAPREFIVIDRVERPSPN